MKKMTNLLGKLFKSLRYLQFALALLLIISLLIGIGSIIEQDQPASFYLESYSKPLFGFMDGKFLLTYQLDHIYQTWWFVTFLVLLGLSLLSCSFFTQLPIFRNSKDSKFKTQKNSYSYLSTFLKLEDMNYFQETFLLFLQQFHFSVYQKNTVIYGCQGLLGRISPMLVHFSLLLILSGSSLGAFQKFTDQEFLPKGEIFHLQNPFRSGIWTNPPTFPLRVNDFWVEYKANKISQYYSNLSVLNNFGKEIHYQTISVNNPLRFEGIDVYQSDWKLLAFRLQTFPKIREIPLISFQTMGKMWISWIDSSAPWTFLFDQFENIFFIYDKTGKFITTKNVGEFLTPTLQVCEILPATGFFIKYDPSLPLIYSGFGGLMITTLWSYFPYTQIWGVSTKKGSWLGGYTNRGKIHLEIMLESILRNCKKKLGFGFLKQFDGA
jgi:cytochrome c biogenesis protein